VVTREMIWKSANELDAEGVKPTLVAVRKRVGGGSFTTISEAMAEWRLRRREATQAAALEPLPPEVGERLGALAAEIWALARGAAEKALAGERAEMAVQDADRQTQLAEAGDLVDRLTEEGDRFKQELGELRPFRAAHDKLAAQLADVQRQSAAEIGRAAEQAARLEAEAKAARQAEKEAIERAARAEGKVEALQMQLAELTATLRRSK
jgi:predicted regulator of Ras-like GTPase activity (Roadblock/LC7/MglB family)